MTKLKRSARPVASVKRVAKKRTEAQTKTTKVATALGGLEAESIGPSSGGVIKQLIQRGNSYALVVDRNLMGLMGIEPDTPLRLTVSGGALRVERADTGIGPEKLAESYRKLQKNKSFHAAMKRLAR